MKSLGLKIYVIWLMVHKTVTNEVLLASELGKQNMFDLSSHANEICPNPCMSCQSTLYHLKFNESGECQFNQCPKQCISITNKWNANTNPNYIIFKSNQLDVCGTCFRESLCSINDCLTQKSLIKKAMENAAVKVDLHIINTSELTFEAINKKSEDYFFNMDFVMRNLKKLEKILSRYESILNESSYLFNLYKRMALAKMSSTQSYEQLKMLANTPLPQSFSIQYKDTLENLSIFKTYYQGLKSHQIRLNDDKIFGKHLL